MLGVNWRFWLSSEAIVGLFLIVTATMRIMGRVGYSYDADDIRAITRRNNIIALLCIMGSEGVAMLVSAMVCMENARATDGTGAMLWIHLVVRSFIAWMGFLLLSCDVDMKKKTGIGWVRYLALTVFVVCLVALITIYVIPMISATL